MEREELVPLRVFGARGRSRRSDEDLLALAHAGDAASFEELFKRHRSELLGYCVMRLNDRESAEDAVQETMLRASRPTDVPVENVGAWLFAIARNVCFDSLRRRQTTPQGVELEAVVDSLASAASESAFAALDVPGNVFLALRRLPSRDRDVVIQREFHDRSSAAIADELGTSAANVDVIVSRARAAFGKAYAEVSELPQVCRRAMETMYREEGSGATPAAVSLMKVHLETCPRCEAEYRRMRSPRFANVLLFPVWLGLREHVLTPLALRWHKVAEVTSGGVAGAGPSSWSVPVKATVAVAIAAVALAPVAAHRPGDAVTRPFEASLAARLAPIASMRAWPIGRAAGLPAPRSSSSSDGGAVSSRRVMTRTEAAHAISDHAGTTSTHHTASHTSSGSQHTTTSGSTWSAPDSGHTADHSGDMTTHH
jgi:RNA polymerase sigma factor (sigma-70 family)